MGILNIYTDVAGQIGVQPRRVTIVTTDNLATITTAGYLNPSNLQGYTIYKTDEIHILYGATGSFGVITTAGTLGIFTPDITNSLITLNQWENPGNVLLPVVDGHVPVFNGTTGQIEDIGLVPSDAAQDIIAMVATSTIIGNLLEATDLVGTLGDSGIVADNVMVAGFANPDTNANIIYGTSSNITNASIVAGTTLFTPTGSKTYTLLNAALNVTSSFSGGSNDSDLSFGVGATTVITATSAAIKAAAQSYALGQAGFTLIAPVGIINAANPLKIVTDGASDYSGGIANIVYTLIRLS